MMIDNQTMIFPKTFKEFADMFSIKDTDEVYSNGIDFIPVFRVEQWLEHTMAIKSLKQEPKTGHWIFDEILDKHYYCSECKSMGVDYWDYCPNCGCRMVEPQERGKE